jgi:Basic region leucine zipper
MPLDRQVLYEQKNVPTFHFQNTSSSFHKFRHQVVLITSFGKISYWFTILRYNLSRYNLFMTMDSMTSSEARQRRMERLRTNTQVKDAKTAVDDPDPNESTDSDDSWSSSSCKTTTTTSASAKRSRKKRKTMDESGHTMTAETTSALISWDLSLIRGIKKQARYEPTVPMSSKVELAAWRKEARRIRNRESAAASRNKTRQRIEELEQDLTTLQDQYDAAQQRIAMLEAQLTQRNNANVEEHISSTVPVTKTVSTNQVSPILSPRGATVAPSELNIMTPEENDLGLWTASQQHAAEVLANSLIHIPSDENLIHVVDQEVHQESVCLPKHMSQEELQPTVPSTNTLTATIHQNIMISRPTAVCVVPI